MGTLMIRRLVHDSRMPEIFRTALSYNSLNNREGELYCSIKTHCVVTRVNEGYNVESYSNIFSTIQHKASLQKTC